MNSLPVEWIGRLAMRVGARYTVGDTPSGGRRVDFLAEGGRFDGPRFTGTVMGGVDDALRRTDGSLTPDVRVVIRATDGGLVHLSYRALLIASREVTDAVWGGLEADSSMYRLRATLRFETASATHAWLNDVIGVGVGERVADETGSRGIRFDIYQVL